MALQRDAKYSGRYDAATPAQPQGAFKNRTSPTSQDGSYMEKDWLNDWSAYMSSLLEANGITPNGLVDEVGASQYFQGMLQLRQVEPLNNDWNGFFDPKHQAQLPSPAGYPDTSGAGGTIYGADDEWSLGNYSSGAANTISSDDDGVIFSVGTYKLFTFTSEQLALINVNEVPVYLVDETGKRHFVNNDTTGVNITKPDSTTLKVELTNAIFAELGITKVWEFFVTDGVGYVVRLDPSSLANAVLSNNDFRSYNDVTGSRTSGVDYANPNDYPIIVTVIYSQIANATAAVDLYLNNGADLVESNYSYTPALASKSTVSCIVAPGQNYRFVGVAGNKFKVTEFS